MNAEPEIVFKYLDPHPESLRSSVDKAIKELQTIASISEVTRMFTHSLHYERSTLTMKVFELLTI